ncbi:MAG TPA: cation transporter [Gracilimonas sp.]|uniref:cation transporter n=1 Tax=Gracilimonas sp. TaxID=1974203 RepID=UPI002DA06CAD|nr:cation transporter [Gracilimonas sp.]
MKSEQGKKDLKTSRKIQIYSVAYNVIEAVVSLYAGFASGSAALIGWGLDSIVEVISASTVWWRFKGEIEGISEQGVKRRSRISLYVIASSFIIISIFITYDSITSLLNREVPDWSTAGIIILVISLVINPVIIWANYKYGKKLKNKELIAKAKDTFICMYQTIAVLGGLLVVRYLDLWWADPVAAFLIVPYALKEGWGAFQDGKNIG